MSFKSPEQCEENLTSTLWHIESTKTITKQNTEIYLAITFSSVTN